MFGSFVLFMQGILQLFYFYIANKGIAGPPPNVLWIKSQTLSLTTTKSILYFNCFFIDIYFQSLNEAKKSFVFSNLFF